ncbi:amino acid adenylation domain-containing protein [Pseudomonas tructae]|uniref:Amino acid adenylation domain-containing protein n=1 Tax=Pseudomonas tructae TaxID=2518644 RepID=A0A411MCL1_9PSED|nr:non-ribosomal peptide synthetase [Pseudomonas tructae]QBF24547.1 amino acid adenylation domain-containing protein [Pseudomonas tructae]
MRRLEILIIGASPALILLHQDLLDHGHALHLADSAAALQQRPWRQPQLLIDDGSLALSASEWHGLGDCACLSLRLGVYLPSDLQNAGELPTLELLCWTGSVTAQRLIERQRLAPEKSGNGQQLRLQAIASLQEMLALQVSRFSRNPEYLQQTPTINPGQEDQQQDLSWLEQLAWFHRLNQRDNPPLLAIAEIALIEHLQQSLQVHADHPALNLNGQRISYAQLHAQTAAIQQQLPAPSASSEPPVIGVCLGKSVALYASLLAVLGDGAVYLPLDPAHPVERLRYILADAGASLLLHDGQVPMDDLAVPNLDLRRLPKPLTQPLPSLLRRRPAPDAPCVAIYTSGTTGQPKGVLLSQRNLSHFQAWYSAHVQLAPHSRVLQFSTISFDASLLDILPTWVCGAELVIPNQDQRRDPACLLALLHEQDVTHAFLPPALLSILPRDQATGLRHLITGGDVCEPEVIERLAGQCQLHNIYGPTETTVLATTRVFASGDSNRNLGQPIANARVLILDERMQPVAEQTPGELYLGGPGVGIGYVNNPQLSAERFVSLPLPDGNSLRLYRTGDIGKWTSAGIELCGRRDNQVKIRGFRVEPEEIEHCLRRSNLFRQVAVVIDGQRRILAFCAQANADGAETGLRQHAEQQLPDYMRPAFYQHLAQMPYTANGKIDRQALLALPLDLTPSNLHLGPVTPVQAQLVGLWSDLLELPEDDISTDASFFSLGGHSILLSRLLLAIRERFGRGIPINQFIQMPTVQRLATLLDSEQAQVQGLDPQAERDACRPLNLQVLPMAQLGDVHKVIVTGANSFLGVHLVEALLEWGASEVACLVRSSADQSAQQRFGAALLENGLHGLDMSRVKVFAADLRQPHLGLAEAEYRYLDSEYGALLHNAAQVNHVLDYHTLAADNVEPLFECLRLCEGRRKKLFNFISTLSACSAIDADGQVLEQDPASTPPIYIRNGYNLSKWVAERILQRARNQGVWVNLYRPGNITFDSRSGVCQPQRNRLMLMLKGSLQLGQVPALELNFDLMPVDFLARFIAFHSSRYQAGQTVFNLHNPEPLSWRDYVSAFRDSGQLFELVSVEQWQRQLQRVDRSNALFDVLGFYLDGFEEDIGDISRIEHGNARAGVARMGARYPAKTPQLLQRGCQYLHDIAFI